MISKNKEKRFFGNKLRFRTYPYTAVRVLAMKSLLLKKEDYMKMQKMGINETTRFLEERHYKKEIDALSKGFRGIELINLALNASIAHDVNKLLRISINEEVKNMIKLYSNKWVVNNLKIIIRVKINRLDKEFIHYGIIPIAPTTHGFCITLYNADEKTMAKEIEKILPIDADEFLDFYRKSDLTSIENMLDKQYYNMLYEASKNVKSKIIKEFLQNLVELINIRNVVKLKISDIDKKIIEDFVIGDKGSVITKLLEGDIKDVLEKSKYSALAEGIEKDPANLENNIENFLLQYSSKLLHSKSMSISPIFGYLLAKEIEVRNLGLLINSKISGLEEEFIEKNLIMV